MAMEFLRKLRDRKRRVAALEQASEALQRIPPEDRIVVLDKDGRIALVRSRQDVNAALRRATAARNAS
ncbi:MAG: hypothetical protein EA356_08555 [Geminicoccaceae bacterium]|nr:MAG: hypothetical protein EA356_08555 [Geminicoccaceae bacterium]